MRNAAPHAFEISLHYDCNAGFQDGAVNGMEYQHLLSTEPIRSLKVARDGNAHERMLNKTEATIRFGLFMITMMYFR